MTTSDLKQALEYARSGDYEATINALTEAHQSGGDIPDEEATLLCDIAEGLSAIWMSTHPQSRGAI